jgi:hypothetical protein
LIGQTGIDSRRDTAPAARGSRTTSRPADSARPAHGTPRRTPADHPALTM